jgi:AraC family transcriptional regulator
MSTSLQAGYFIGALRGTRHVSGLTLAETEYRPNLIVPQHAHEHALFCLILDGSFTERTASRRTLCTTGSLIYQPGGEPHAHEFHEHGGLCFNIQFGPEWVERISAFGMGATGTPRDLHRSKAGWLARHLHQEFRTADSASTLAIEGLALALVGEISRARSRSERGARPPWLIRAVEYLHAHAREPLSLAELAARVDIDPTHLGRTFREHYGCTMSEYVRRLRIEFARHELTATGRSIAAIAVSAGFADQAHFSRVFKQLTGLTPAVYRATAALR